MAPDRLRKRIRQPRPRARSIRRFSRAGTREGAAYRDGDARQGAPNSASRTARSPRQTIDLFPGKDATTDAPLAVFIHGGWWRSLEPAIFSQMARGPNAHGVNVAVAGYDLCPQVSIADIIEQMRAACLLLWRTAQEAHDGQRPFRRRPSCRLHGGDRLEDARRRRAGRSGAGRPTRSPACSTSRRCCSLAERRSASSTQRSAARVSPLFWHVPPQAAALDAVVGAHESSEFLRQSKIIADAWREQAR